ncbi:MAG TPA: hypothetical protein VFO55_12175 [Gemmatimonadaceae bacterium]|nr:hypothetical protein [Gemmatimonadaceae bacterium]
MPLVHRSSRLLAGLGALALSMPAVAQQPAATPAPAPLINEPSNPVLRGFKWRSIGPVGQGVRVDDFAVDEKNPSTYYVGFAVTGILKTTNNGTTFQDIFPTYGSASIADLTLAPSDANILYVATGEANNRQTTSYGDGLYKSTDAGKTFRKIGFENSQTLGRVLVHPRDPNTVWIAVGGNLYGPSDDRGVWMSTNGGNTWTKTLFVDNNTSATEIAIDPANPNHLLAAMYQRQRTAWGFAGGGPGSGLYESNDGGRTWKKQTGNGLPRGTMGRIALDFSRSNPNVVYAQIEVAADREPAPAGRAAAPPAGGRGAAGGGGGGGGGRGAAPPDPTRSGVWRSANGGRSWTYVSSQNQRPMYFSQIRVDPNNPDVVYVGGVGPMKSTDGGKTWNGLGNMGHVDNHAIWINPSNSNHVMYGNDGGIDVSYDGGQTWESNRVGPWGMGLSYHASVDMRRPYRVCTGLQDNGSWCGPSHNRTADGIRQWNWISVGGGDGFQSQIDPTDPNIFYTESQNGNINRYDLTNGTSVNVRPRGPGGGGRGGAGAAPGGGQSNIINLIPGATIAFNWNTPIRLSPHNPSTVLFGGRSMFISRNRGDSWWMTKELGKGINPAERSIMGQSYALPNCPVSPPGTACILSRNDGYVANEFGTITELAESPLLPGVYWAGTDDGNIQVSRDGGNTWEEVGRNIPGVNHEYYVSGLEASWFDAGTAYAALDGHRHDDLRPYVFKTTDYGRTWTSVAGNLPARHVVNSIRQDPVNRNLLYAPTELGFFISLDDGRSWEKFMPNLPTGRVDDVVVHPRENDLVLATHSRSVWIMDDISALQRLTADRMSADATLLPTRDAVLWKNDRRLLTEVPGDKWWQGENAPAGTAISFYLKNAGGDAKITITDVVTGQEVRSHTMPALAGLNRWQWNMCGNAVAGAAGGGRGGGGGGFGGAGACQGGTPPRVGTYRVSVSAGGREIGSQVFRVLEDIWLN